MYVEFFLPTCIYSLPLNPDPFHGIYKKKQTGQKVLKTTICSCLERGTVSSFVIDLIAAADL